MKEDGKGTLSRRNFLKGSLVGAAGIAAVGMLGGCADSGGESDNGTGGAVPNAELNYEVVNCDLIIVGCGYNGMAAAYEAIERGQRVTIIDKGPYGHSGGAGFNWDIWCGYIPSKEVLPSEGLLKNTVNQELFYQCGLRNDHPNNVLEMVRRGDISPWRNSDGTIHWYTDFPVVRSAEGMYPRTNSDTLATSPLVTIVDRTMVTDVLLNNGRCLGVIAMHLPTGEIRVYRAPATIAASGPTAWFYGWSTVSPYSINSTDNTSDLDMACFRHGAGIGDSEHCGYDFATSSPDGLGFGWGTILNPDANEWFGYADKDGNPLIDPETTTLDMESIAQGNRTYFNRALAQMLHEGRGTETGGFKAISDGKHLRRTIETAIPIFEEFGVDIYTDMMDIHDEIYERGGSPVIDEYCKTDFEGLYHGRGAGVAGTIGGGTSRTTFRFGLYASLCAMDYLESAPEITNVDWAPVEEEIARLNEIRTRIVNDGLRPHEIRHRIQKTCGTCMGILREQKALDATATELARIRAEDMPKQMVTSPSRTWNTEWKEAIENYNLLDAAELAVRATIERQESRGTYWRPEFPDVDDENWNCMLVGTLKDGKIVFTKRELPEHTDWSAYGV